MEAGLDNFHGTISSPDARQGFGLEACTLAGLAVGRQKWDPACVCVSDSSFSLWMC
jgi:hypothetical protein